MKKIIAMLIACLFVLPFSACKKTPDAVSPQGSQLPDAERDAAVDSLLSTMSLEEKIYQLFVAAPEQLCDESGVTEATDALREGLTKYPVGGVILFGDNIQSREQVEKLLREMQEASKIPLFTAVDEEGGIVSRLSGVEDMGVTAQPSMQEVGESGDAGRAYEIGKTIGTEIKAIGFNTNFAPVADLILSEDNTEIGSRSFGSDPVLVSSMVENMVRGLRDGGVACALKHFPGHGSANADSHSGRAYSYRTLEEMQSADFLPFVAGIGAFSDFVMISHMINQDITKTNMECSMSTNVMTNILRNGIGFPGIIITDSLSMGAITKYYSAGAAAVTALEAGADMLLMPQHIEEAADAIRGAVSSGRIKEEKIDASVKRIIKTKLTHGIL